MTARVVERSLLAETGLEPAARPRIDRALALLSSRHRDGTADERSKTALEFIGVLDDDACTAKLTPELRSEFVKAVLELGYPWALYLKSEDAQLVSRSARPPTARRALVAGLVALVCGVAVSGLGFASRSSANVGEVTERANQTESEQPLPAVFPPTEACWPVVTSLGDGRYVNVKPVREVHFEPLVYWQDDGRTTTTRPRRIPSLPRPAIGGWLDPALVLERLVAKDHWETVIEQGDACRKADPLRLDCLAHVAAAHARLSRLEPAPHQPAIASRLAELRRLEHERAARAMYRRYLSLAPSSDGHAPKIVRLLRQDGDWVEWTTGDLAATELKALTETAYCDSDECLERRSENWARRARRTGDPDDVALAAQARRQLDAWRALVTNDRSPQ
ncbi:MAG: hypothetical protein Q8L14_11630 [Myxococcales bacterium]|nr:hypothetical protein [Myxococcales bacterium]